MESSKYLKMSLTDFSNYAQESSRLASPCLYIFWMSFFKWLLQRLGSRKPPPPGPRGGRPSVGEYPQSPSPCGEFPPGQFLNSSNASILIKTVNMALICYKCSQYFELFNEILCPESSDRHPMAAIHKDFAMGHSLGWN